MIGKYFCPVKCSDIKNQKITRMNFFFLSFFLFFKVRKKCSCRSGKHWDQRGEGGATQFRVTSNVVVT
jgi:hypothetical protein